MANTPKIDFSIVICSFNPDKRLLNRALRSICNLNLGNQTKEIILVDNNSNPPLQERDYIQNYLNQYRELKVVTERKPGLINARITGIETSLGETVIFFDDDNEPNDDYLKKLTWLKEKYPDVGAWGPGIVDVDFIDGIEEKIANYARAIFQERNESEVTLSNEKEWQPCYPFGTGLCLEKKILLNFIQFVKNNTYTLTGRTKDQLASGEDLQIVLFFIKMGRSAGVSPDLKVTHIIPKKRTTHSYLKKISFGTTICVPVCQMQIFPEFESKLREHMYPPFKFSKKALTSLYKISITKNRIKQYKLISFIAYRSGIYQSFNKKLPNLVRFVIKILNLI